MITEGPAHQTDNEAVGERPTGDPSGADLRLLPYSEWLKWRTLFYTWLKAWTTRMDKKTGQLVAQAERRQRLAAARATAAPPSAPAPAQASQPMDEEAAPCSDNKAAAASPTAMPDNFCPGTIVEVCSYYLGVLVFY